MGASASHDQVEKWSSDNIIHKLDELSSVLATAYGKAVVDNCIDGTMLLTLSERDLEKVGYADVTRLQFQSHFLPYVSVTTRTSAWCG